MFTGANAAAAAQNQVRKARAGAMVDPAQGGMVKVQPKAPKIYKSPRIAKGPVGEMPLTTTFYDLIMNPEYAEVRSECFEDWVFPEIIDGADDKRFMGIQRVCVRGGRHTLADSTQSVSQTTMMHYAYVLINMMKMPVASFGEFPGQTISHTSTLVCVEVGDPRIGRTTNAHINYAVPLNALVKDCVSLVQAFQGGGGQSIDPESSKFHYVYEIISDQSLVDELTARWWYGDDYYFNSIIFPKIRQAAGLG